MTLRPGGDHRQLRRWCIVIEDRHKYAVAFDRQRRVATGYLGYLDLEYRAPYSLVVVVDGDVETYGRIFRGESDLAIDTLEE